MKVLKFLIIISFLFCIVKAGREVKLFGRLEGELLADIFNNGYKENVFVLAIAGLQFLGVYAAIKDGYKYNRLMLVIMVLLGCIVLAGTLTLSSFFQTGSIPNILYIALSAIYIRVYVQKYNVI